MHDLDTEPFCLGQLRIVLADRSAHDNLCRAENIFGDMSNNNQSPAFAQFARIGRFFGIGAANGYALLQKQTGDPAHPDPADPYKVDSTVSHINGHHSTVLLQKASGYLQTPVSIIIFSGSES